MKIAQSSPYVVRDGDQIKVSVSHQIKVGREESWLGYEIGTTVKHTDDKDLEARLIEHANTKVMEHVDEAVKKIQEKQT